MSRNDDKVDEEKWCPKADRNLIERVDCLFLQSRLCKRADCVQGESVGARLVEF